MDFESIWAPISFGQMSLNEMPFDQMSLHWPNWLCGYMHTWLLDVDY